MADYAIHDTTLEDIADAIRKNEGSVALIDPADFAERIGLMGMLPKGKASGSIAHITDGANDVPTSSCEVDIAPTLTGVSSVSVVRTGKNLIIAPTYSASSDSLCLDLGQDMTFDSLTLSFLATNSEVDTITSAIVDYREDDGTHHYRTLNDFTDSNNVRFSASGANNGVFKNTYSNITFRYVYVSYTSASRSKFTSDSLSNWQLEVGSTATAYEAYETPTTYTASLGRTVYGGSADIVNGTGTEKYTNTSLTDKDYYYSSTLQRFDCTLDGVISSGYMDDFIPPQGYTINHALINDASNAPDYTMCIYGGKLYIKNLSCSSVPELVSDMSGKYLTYSLATPTDFTFTGVEVPTRLGVNNFFSDVGDTSIEYRKDIGLAIGLNKYRYLRWKISATRTTSSYCQMSDIEFTDASNNKFTFPTGTTVTADTTATSGTGTAYIIDNNTSTKFCGNWKTGGITITIDLGIGNTIDVTQFKKFSWYTANDANDRDPITWELYGIDVSNSPVLLCSRTAYTPTTDRKALADTVNITSV